MQVTIDKVTRGGAEPEIVHKDCRRFAAAQESKGKLQCAKVFRAVDQNDVARLDQFRQEKK